MPRINTPPAPKLNVEHFDAKHIEGNTKPGTRIEVRNLSRGTQDVMVEADAQGTSMHRSRVEKAIPSNYT